MEILKKLFLGFLVCTSALSLSAQEEFRNLDEAFQRLNEITRELALDKPELVPGEKIARRVKSLLQKVHPDKFQGQLPERENRLGRELIYIKEFVDDSYKKSLGIGTSGQVVTDKMNAESLLSAYLNDKAGFNPYEETENKKSRAPFVAAIDSQGREFLSYALRSPYHASFFGELIYDSIRYNHPKLTLSVLGFIAGERLSYFDPVKLMMGIRDGGESGVKAAEKVFMFLAENQSTPAYQKMFTQILNFVMLVDVNNDIFKIALRAFSKLRRDSARIVVLELLRQPNFRSSQNAGKRQVFIERLHAFSTSSERTQIALHLIDHENSRNFQKIESRILIEFLFINPDAYNELSMRKMALEFLQRSEPLYDREFRLMHELLDLVQGKATDSKIYTVEGVKGRVASLAKKVKFESTISDSKESVQKFTKKAVNKGASMIRRWCKGNY